MTSHFNCLLCDRYLLEIATYFWARDSIKICPECHPYAQPHPEDRPVWYLGPQVHREWLEALRKENEKDNAKTNETLTQVRDCWIKRSEVPG